MTFTFKTLAGALTVALTATASWAADYTMRLSHQFPPTHHTALRLEQFAKDVSAATGGKVEVQLFGGAQLFKPQQHHAAVAGGEIESAIILNLQWGGTLPEMSIALIPYLISSPKAQKAFISSDAAKFLDDKMLALGVKNIAWIVDANDLIFTSNGHTARYAVERFQAGMCGVNIGVPVPREPFSFGGWNDSKFGHGDITGMDGFRFWTRPRKVTSRWSIAQDATWMS